MTRKYQNNFKSPKGVLFLLRFSIDGARLLALKLHLRVLQGWKKIFKYRYQLVSHH